MEKRNRIKKFMAIIAILLFIGPLFVVAVMNYSTYYESKQAEKIATSETADTTADESTEEDTTEE